MIPVILFNLSIFLLSLVGLIFGSLIKPPLLRRISGTICLIELFMFFQLIGSLSFYEYLLRVLYVPGAFQFPLFASGTLVVLSILFIWNPLPKAITRRIAKSAMAVLAVATIALCAACYYHESYQRQAMVATMDNDG
ncbi:MAG: hypothetical protein LBC41_02865 [Clostridiales bacterium]|jgi:hypothetical protein|nr:hypothetical protein [Clostridiales bacterium]